MGRHDKVLGRMGKETAQEGNTSSLSLARQTVGRSKVE